MNFEAFNIRFLHKGTFTPTHVRQKLQALRGRTGTHPYQSYAVVIKMADISNPDKEEAVSKGIAKRKYLLVDNDLEGLEFELKDNPLNKSYG